MDGFLHAAGSNITSWVVARVVEEEDGVTGLLEGEEDADLGTEGGKHHGPGAVAGLVEDVGEYRVNEEVELDGIEIHFPAVDGFEGHGILWGKEAVRMMAGCDTTGTRYLLISILNGIDSGTFSSNSFRVMNESWI